MAVRTIVTTPDPVLRRKAKKVTVFDKDLQTLIDDMIETMRQAPGVGLAAPQVGISLRVIVVEYGENDEDEDAPKKLYAVINPEIVRRFDRIGGRHRSLSLHPAHHGRCRAPRENRGEGLQSLWQTGQIQTFRLVCAHLPA